MFGIIWGTIIGIGAAISSGKQAKENKYLRDKAIENDKKRINVGKVSNGTYWKLKNGKYSEYTYDGKQVIARTDKNGDNILTDVYNTITYRNLSEEQRQLNFQYNKNIAESGTIAVPIGYIKNNLVYQNINNNDRYYERYIDIYKYKKKKEKYGGLYFYVSVNNNKLICVSDKSLKEMKNIAPVNKYRSGEPIPWATQEDIDTFIKNFNMKQNIENDNFNKYRLY